MFKGEEKMAQAYRISTEGSPLYCSARGVCSRGCKGSLGLRDSFYFL